MAVNAESEMRLSTGLKQDHSYDTAKRPAAARLLAICS
jgi:hypothetical protein